MDLYPPLPNLSKTQGSGTRDDRAFGEIVLFLLFIIITPMFGSKG